MAVIAKILFLSMACVSGSLAACEPTRSETQFNHAFQYSYSNSFQNYIQFPILPYYPAALSIPNYYVPRKPVVDTNPMPNTNYQWRNVATTTEKTIDSKKVSPKSDCTGLNATECENYRNLLETIFPRDKTTDVKSDNNKENENTINNYDAHKNYFEYNGQNGNLNTPEGYINSDYDTSTDDLSFRVPPPYIVAALLGG